MSSNKENIDFVVCTPPTVHETLLSQTPLVVKGKQFVTTPMRERNGTLNVKTQQDTLNHSYQCDNSVDGTLRRQLGANEVVSMTPPTEHVKNSFVIVQHGEEETSSPFQVYYNSKIDEAESEYTNVKNAQCKTCYSLMEQLKRAESARREQHDELDRVQCDFINVTEDCKAFAEAYSKLQNELLELHGLYQSKCSTLKDVSEDFMVIMKENQGKNAIIHDLEARCYQNERITTELQSRLLAMQSTSDAGKSSIIASNTSNKLENLETAYHTLQLEKEELEKTSQALLAENFELDTKMQDQTRVNMELQERLDFLNADYESQVQSLRKQVKDFEKALEMQNVAFQELEAFVHEETQLRNSCINTLESQLNEVNLNRKSLKEEKYKLEQKTAFQEKEVETLQQKVSDILQQLKSTEMEHTSACNTLNEQLAQQRQEFIQSIDSLNSLRSQHEALMEDMQTKEALIQTLRNDLDKLEKYTLKYKQSAELKVQTLRSNLQKAEAEVDSLDLLLQSARVTLSQHMPQISHLPRLCSLAKTLQDISKEEDLSAQAP